MATQLFNLHPRDCRTNFGILRLMCARGFEQSAYQVTMQLWFGDWYTKNLIRVPVQTYYNLPAVTANRCNGRSEEGT